MSHEIGTLFFNAVVRHARREGWRILIYNLNMSAHAKAT